MKNKFSIDKFNKVYKDNRLEDYNDYGYGDIMEESSQNRDDLDIRNTIGKFSKNRFHQSFCFYVHDS